MLWFGEGPSSTCGRFAVFPGRGSNAPEPGRGAFFEWKAVLHGRGRKGTPYPDRNGPAARIRAAVLIPNASGPSFHQVHQGADNPGHPFIMQIKVQTILIKS
jgi:hypothetical protein